MGPYKSFAECVQKNKNKSNPRAYCGMIYWSTEGRKKLKTKKYAKNRK